MGCMKEYEEGLKSCPYCGYVEGINGNVGDYLSTSTILQGRYIVGIVVNEEAERTCYIGYDALLEKIVLIYETFHKQKKLKNVASQVVDDFQVGEATYIVTEYQAELPQEIQAAKNSKKPILIVAVIVISLILILALMLPKKTGQSEPSGMDTEAIVEMLEDVAEEEEAEESIEVEEVIEVEEEIEVEIVEITEIDLGEFVNEIGGDETMEFIIANFWMDVNYGESTITGTVKELDEDISESNVNSNVATKILKETVTENSLVLEGVITVIIDQYDGDYIEAPHWFVYEMDQEGNYSIVYDEVENTASKVTASYELTDSYGSYTMKNALDGKATTTWSPEKADGNYALFEYSEEKEIYGVLLLNGYWKSSDTYTNNGRVTEMTICTDTYDLGTFNLNTAGYQSSIADQGIYNYMVLFEEPITSSELYLILEDSIDGSKFEDVCISEILVIAR